MAIAKAVRSETGEAIFDAAAPKNGALDGLRDTGRGGVKRTITVPVTTIDIIWNNLGRPSISVIKIDIEGGELGALQSKYISTNRPTLIDEGTEQNLKSYVLDTEV